jgi:hypothetical protein
MTRPRFGSTWFDYRPAGRHIRRPTAPLALDPPPPSSRAAGKLSRGCSAVPLPRGSTFFLCLAAVQLVNRKGTATLAYGVSVWVVQLIMPLGFGVIALQLRDTRLMVGADVSWRLRWRSPGLNSHPPLAPPSSWCGLVALLAAVILRTYLCHVGGAALILFWGEGADRVNFSHIIPWSPIPPCRLSRCLRWRVFSPGRNSKRLIRVFRRCWSWVGRADHCPVPPAFSPRSGARRA